ncbi:hypothetical protein FIBSPDRAFT_1049153 [Athelia psychrophila]|uniref:Uncharacterized protein n=1 Tax=Athelia psychrophila TaxID=1759441 RepID=A0A166CQ12_9AGAM|nr:hypothetical protein FIBSPDRAFT_1049153 [Fibularhizoctonia sp. CBS 109695]
MAHDTRPPPLPLQQYIISLSFSNSLLKARTEHHAQCSWSYLLLAPDAAPSCMPMEQIWYHVHRVLPDQTCINHTPQSTPFALTTRHPTPTFLDLTLGSCAMLCKVQCDHPEPSD